MTNFKTAADIAQKSIDHFYASPDKKQFMNNVYPLKNEKENEVFNYWWLAHLVDVRIDAYLRTNDEEYLKMAEETYRYNKNRNHDTLLHEYYDDMLWNALAALRLFELTKKQEYFEDAKEVCLDIFDTAWNDYMDGGFAWKRTQLDYKNTPVNAPIIILALRLYQIEKDSIYLETSKRTLAWMKEKLVHPDSQFVEDGINRNGDGKLDEQWRFTYNQGVYIGALLEFYQVTKEQTYLEEALQCAKTSIETMTEQGVFNDEGDGGDIGLFKGIEYRYLGLLYQETHAGFIKDFVEASCTILIENALKDEHLLAYRDWLVTEMPNSVYLSDHLSGVMALESAVSL
ncbi:glycosyl hydrolase family 76 [Enterococcus faecalis 13-SD-W-01]|nr:glycosyl hydrolase family 76 [Enterococcus faecalis 13-SD-W-01]